jgi:hypothetical protein
MASANLMAQGETENIAREMLDSEISRWRINYPNLQVKSLQVWEAGGKWYASCLLVY